MIAGQYGNDSRKGPTLVSTVAPNSLAFANHLRNLLLVFNAAVEVQMFLIFFLISVMSSGLP